MQNFGKIKNVFNNLFVENIIRKDNTTKKLFKRYLKTIKKSEILKTQFFIYNNIENKIDGDVMSANLFISENIKLLEKYSKSDILKENQKLVNLVNKFEDKVVESYEYSTLHESLANLIFIKRTPKNIEKITEEIKNINKFISTNKAKEVNSALEVPISILTNIMVEKYNEKYNTLDEFDKKILKTLIESDIKGKQKLYDEIVKECVTLVEKLLDNADGESKEKLLRVKTKLDEKDEVNEEELIIRISKLIGLRNNLKN